MNMSNVLNLKIGDIAKVYAGGTPSRKHPEYWGGTIPWVKTTHIQNCTIERDDIDEAITDIGLKFSSARVVSEGTILMAMIGQGKTRGQVAILNVEAAINQNCVAIVLNEDIDRDYLWHQLRFRYHAIRNISNSSGQQNLNGEIIKGIVLPFPSHEKQHCIGKILNQWDAAIEKTEALIDAKERQFRWLQSSTIKNAKNTTGQKFGNFLRESRLPDTINNPEKRLTVRLHLKGVDIREYRGTEQRDATQYFVRKAGQFIYGKQNIFRGAIGIVPNELDGYTSSQDIPAFDIDKNIHSDWLYWYVSRSSFYKKLEHFAAGSGSRRLHPKELLRLYANVPSIDEQRRIANVLNAAQQEISLLKELVSQYHTQKRGLMQNLLTRGIQQ